MTHNILISCCLEEIYQNRRFIAHTELAEPITGMSKTKITALGKPCRSNSTYENTDAKYFCFVLGKLLMIVIIQEYRCEDSFMQ